MGDIHIYMAYSGRFLPKNPQKYRGDPTNIIYRSTWERRVMVWLDETENIVEWGSEELIIPYRSPVDGKYHRYFPDFFVKTKNSKGEIKVMVIEVKPLNQTFPPQRKKRITKQYIQEVTTWAINQSKWKYAVEYCKDKGWQFCVMTSKDGSEFKVLTESQLVLT
jgi:hypothetical protein